MALKQVMTCDECGVQKGEGNGWFTASLPSPTDAGILLYHAHTDDKDALPRRAHYCGETCVSKVVSRWMSGEGQHVKVTV